MEQLLELERRKSDIAEKARAQLAAEVDLIKKQLDLEQENIKRCKRFLEPEEQARLSETQADQASSPASLE